MKSRLLILIVMFMAPAGCGHDESVEALATANQDNAPTDAPTSATAPAPAEEKLVVLHVNLQINGQRRLKAGPGMLLWVEASLVNPLADHDLPLEGWLQGRKPVFGTEDGVLLELDVTKSFPATLEPRQRAQAIWKVVGEPQSGEYRCELPVDRNSLPRELDFARVGNCDLHFDTDFVDAKQTARFNRRWRRIQGDWESIIAELETTGPRPANLALSLELANAYAAAHRSADEARVLRAAAESITGVAPGKPIPLNNLPCWFALRLARTTQQRFDEGHQE